MKLTELFSGEKQITDRGKYQTGSNEVRGDAVNRQIHSMVPGQTVLGEVISKCGSELQIRLADDVMLQARLEQSMNLEIGKLMTFEVKNHGKILLLSPLFTNIANDANVLKALDMASLPVNDTTVSMAKELMSAGLPVSRSVLQQVYREINLFPNHELIDIVMLHKLQMPVNEGNLVQMESYRNLTHQITGGLNHVLESVPDMFSQMMDSGNADGAVKLYQQLLYLANEGMTAGDVPETIENDKIIVTKENAEEIQMSSKVTDTFVSADALVDKPQTEENEVYDEGLSETRQEILQEAKAMSGRQLAALLNQAVETVDEGTLIRLRLLWKESGGDKEFMNPLLQLIKNQWTITPKELTQEGSVEELYRKLNRQLKGLTRTMENLGQTSGAAYKACVNLNQNLDFMQQLNQVYSYIQLPLRLKQGEAHGELYVYTNKKHLAVKDGQISALLHLDMENLGPVDVYVSMLQNNVKTKFYLKDDELLAFMMEHMDILTERLQKRGYGCDYEMYLRNQEEEGKTAEGIQMLLGEEKHIPLAEYSFDVRT